MSAPEDPQANGDSGERSQEETWVSAAYGELHRIAKQMLAAERAGHTLQPTALVNEAWLRLKEQSDWNDRFHFVATAARSMRRILVDHARTKNRIKRGEGWDRVELDTKLIAGELETSELDMLALDEALTQLEGLNERQARIVELRFFGGLDVEEVAQTLGISAPTVARDWRFARAWLARALG